MRSWNVQLAHSLNDHPTIPGQWFALTQKRNGVRGTFYRSEILGRNGTCYAGLEHIAKALSPYSDFVFDGELTRADPGLFFTPAPRFRLQSESSFCPPQIPDTLRFCHPQSLASATSQ